MLRLLAAFVLIVASAGLIVGRPSPSGGAAAPRPESAADGIHAVPHHSDDDEDCDNSGPGNCEDRGEDDEDGVDEEDQVPVTGEIPADSLVIEILDDDGFTPSTLTVDPGQRVTFVNRHHDVHTATGSGFDTGDIPPGGTATVVLDEPGTFAFACRYHPEMTGSIGVRGPDGVVPPPARAGPPPADATVVEIVDFSFSPASLTIAAGTTVAWTNADTVPHTATAEDDSFDSGILDPGASFSFTFDEPGTYVYRCALHPAMEATITVVADDDAGAPAGGDSTAGNQDDAAGDLAQSGPLTVRLRAGDCAEPGEVVAELEDAVVTPEDDSGAGGADGVIPVAVSATTVDDAVADLMGGDRVVAVGIGDEDPVACGVLGAPAVGGELVVGLGEVAGSGYGGVAVLRQEQAGTTITVYVTGPSSSNESAATNANPAGGEAAVTIAGFALAPPTLEVAVGTTVTWINQDDAPHTVTADDGSFDSGRLDQGQSFSHTFDEAGAFVYHCDFHPDMTATIVVGETGGA
jgi:plastocyanin